VATKEKKIDESNKDAFVICPIGDDNSPERKRSDQILKYIIKPIVQRFGYTAVRSDHISEPGIITSQIVNHILNDPLVIADLTGKNPNVFYELAIRHVIKKPVIQLIQKGERIPFDVASQRTIEIDHKDLDSAENARIELEKHIVAVLKDPSLVDSPISAAINIQSLKSSANPEQNAIADIQTTLGLLSNQVREILGKLPDKLDLIQAHENEIKNALSREVVFEAQLTKKLDQQWKKHNQEQSKKKTN
jgi:hypothetical protein